MKKNSLMQFVMVVVLLALLVTPTRVRATTYSGVITTPQTAADAVTLLNMTNTASGTITQTGGTWIYMGGINTIGGDVTAAFGVLNGGYPGGTFTTTQTAGIFSMAYWYLGAGSYILNGGTISNAVWFQMQGGHFTMNGGTLAGG